jgi:hypothetical protein
MTADGWLLGGGGGLMSLLAQMYTNHKTVLRLMLDTHLVLRPAELAGQLDVKHSNALAEASGSQRMLCCSPPYCAPAAQHTCTAHAGIICKDMRFTPRYNPPILQQLRQVYVL